jgi:uncharacterized protein YndB with AHSA1/START domain
MQTGYITTYKTTINAPIEKVWDALTNPEMVKQYFFGSEQQTDWKVGSPIIWSGEYEGQKYVDKGTVLEFEPNHKLAFSYLSSWSNMEDKPENYLMVTYEVSRAGNGGTELTITQTNYDAEKAAHSAENWKIVIDGMKGLIE